MIPLYSHFPALARIPRASLLSAPTPVTRLDALAEDLWIKRDDLCASPIGGNKVRALEFLFGELERGASVITVGSAGSTHALSVATFGKQLGFDVRVGRWRQEMNDAAVRVSEKTQQMATAAPIFSGIPLAYAWAFWQRARGAHWIPAGGSSPLGVLGHVNAGLEFIEQVNAGQLPMPKTVFVPLGTGGTVAGLTLAFAIARRAIQVVGVRVVPRIVANSGHVRRMIDRTAALIERTANVSVARPSKHAMAVMHEEFGGAYGRETPSGRAASARLHAAYGISLDATYSAKALAQTLMFVKNASGPTLFWLTFDSRTLERTQP